MLSIAQSTSIVGASVACALALLMLLRRFWPPAKRRVHNDIIGWHVGVVGTTYAVILAFMLSGVWNNFETAEKDAEIEANCLVNVFRLSQGLPPSVRETIQDLCRKYAAVMIGQEWPAMSQGSLSPASLQVTQQLWTTVTSAGLRDLSEQTSMNRLLSELTNMTEHRRIRQAQSRSKLPGLLWVVLVMGGAITVFYSCFFGIDDLPLHALQVVALSLMVSLVLVTIADIDQPFRGGVRVNSTAFDSAIQTFSAYPPGKEYNSSHGR